MPSEVGGPGEKVKTDSTNRGCTAAAAGSVCGARSPQHGMQKQKGGNTTGQLHSSLAAAARRIPNRRRHASGQTEWGILPEIDVRPGLQKPENPQARHEGRAELDRAGGVFHRPVTSAAAVRDI